MMKPLPLLALFAGWILCLGTQLCAEEVAPQPTELTSDHLVMTSTDEESRALCTGNVTLTGTNLRITCDRMELIASRIGDKTVTLGKLDRFKYLLATGKVHVTQGDREVTCGRAEVFPREEKVVLTEKPVVIDNSTGIVTSGVRLELLRGQRQILGDGIKISAPPLKDLGPDVLKKSPEADNTPKNAQ